MLNTDRGASAVVIALTMVVIMGFLALAVDIGFGFNERRQDQIGADSGATGGSLEMVVTSQTNPVQAAVDEIYALADQNLGRAIPLADWTGCTDSEALFYLSTDSMFNTTDASPCISLSSDFNTIRVRVPIQGVPTIFGKFLGADTIDVSAAAEAQRNIDWGGGGDFPAGVYSGTNAGDPLCVKFGPSGHETCQDPDLGSPTGSFGMFLPYFYSSVAGDLSSICVSGQQAQSIARAMADGIDHEFSGHLDPALGTGEDRRNGEWCMTSNTPGPPFPNMVRNEAGLQKQAVTMGLVKGGTWPGSASYAGRLDRGPYQDSAHLVFGVDLDNRPLWDFIDDTFDFTSAGAPTCDLAKAHLPIVDRSERVIAITEASTCLAEAMAAVPNPLRVFTTDILASQRVGHSPLFWETGYCGFNSCYYHIKGLVPIFIDGLWAQTSPPFTCSGEFVEDTTNGLCIAYAGTQGTMFVSSPGQQRIESTSAIVLDCALMPVGTCPTLQDGTGPLNFLYDLQLTR